MKFNNIEIYTVIKHRLLPDKAVSLAYLKSADIEENGNLITMKNLDTQYNSNLSKYIENNTVLYLTIEGSRPLEVKFEDVKTDGVGSPTLKLLALEGQER